MTKNSGQHLILAFFLLWDLFRKFKNIIRIVVNKKRKMHFFWQNMSYSKNVHTCWLNSFFGSDYVECIDRLTGVYTLWLTLPVQLQLPFSIIRRGKTSQRCKQPLPNRDWCTQAHSCLFIFIFLFNPIFSFYFIILHYFQCIFFHILHIVHGDDDLAWPKITVSRSSHIFCQCSGVFSSW